VIEIVIEIERHAQAVDVTTGRCTTLFYSDFDSDFYSDFDRDLDFDVSRFALESRTRRVTYDGNI